MKNFFAVDGIEGCGKSSVARRLADRFQRTSYQCVLVQDPGTTDIGKQIRTILLSPTTKGICIRTEMMLFMGSRAQMMYEVILPALDQNVIVISDRFVASTVAYQHGITMEEILKTAEIALGGVLPRRTYVLDLPVEEAMARVQAKFEMDGTMVRDRFEQRNLDFHWECWNRYRNLCSMNPDAYRLVDVACRGIDDVVQLITKDMENEIR